MIIYRGECNTPNDSSAFFAAVAAVEMKGISMNTAIWYDTKQNNKYLRSRMGDVYIKAKQSRNSI